MSLAFSGPPIMISFSCTMVPPYHLSHNVKVTVSFTECFMKFTLPIKSIENGNFIQLFQSVYLSRHLNQPVSHKSVLDLGMQYSKCPAIILLVVDLCCSQNWWIGRIPMCLGPNCIYIQKIHKLLLIKKEVRLKCDPMRTGQRHSRKNITQNSETIYLTFNLK